MQHCTTQIKGLLLLPLCLGLFLVVFAPSHTSQATKILNKELRASIKVPGIPVTFDKKIYGKASWYGKQFHKKRTANGEYYNMFSLSAAHKKLKFDSIVKVTNLNNGETVIVRINDRGPYINGRDIDLSFAAAKHLKMVEDGVVPVKLEIINNKERFVYRHDYPKPLYW
ncbi:septal ring lytic transglycosylase RlpA family protein [bacterium]|nr:septal ring lytic transglycosylase RlpA family protein [bacterium]MBU1917894.1 septal ring lytic transglycosylase RlpA family protein [bacterium]